LKQKSGQPRVRELAAAILLLGLLAHASLSSSAAQTIGNSGTVRGTVTDPSGAAIPAASVEIHNPVSGFDRSVNTDTSGNFEFTNVPFNPYHLSVTATGFQVVQQDVEVRSSVPIDLTINLQIAVSTTSVTVQAEAGDLIERTPTPHTDVDRSLIQTLPIENMSTGLSAAITNSTPGVAADANGFFHPFGDHAQASIVLDNQPINDQYSKLFSNQISLDAIQSMEVVSGVPGAEYGDKTSLVINTVTRSGVGTTPAHGSVSGQYGSFGTSGVDFTLGTGGKKWGNFLAANFTDSSRFLDPPELAKIHDKGNGEGFFDRIDFNPSESDTLHLNLSASRSWFQTPNTFDQLAVGQDQHQQIRSLNIAPGYTRLFSSTTLLTFNPFFRLDHVQYYPSEDPFSDTPATLSEDRRLAVLGARADVSYSHGIHNAKGGVEFQHHLLTENFSTGLTDPTFNPVCLNPDGSPDGNPTPADPVACARLGLRSNPGLAPGLIPFDLTRGGKLFNFHDTGDIKQIALYGQDQIAYGQFAFNLGVRGDVYRGLSRASQIEPRVGIAYTIKPTATVLRVSYGRFLETPYNENLLRSEERRVGKECRSRWSPYH